MMGSHVPDGRVGRTRASRSGALLVLIVVLPAIAGLWFGAALGEPDSPNGPLAINQDHLDLGEVWSQKALHVSIPVRSLAPKRLAVRTVPGSCACVLAVPEVFQVPAGGSRRVELTLDVTARKMEDHEKPIRDVTVPLVCVIDDWRVETFHFRARVKRHLLSAAAGKEAVLLGPADIAFGRPIDIDDSPARMEILVQTAAEIRGIRVKTSDRLLSSAIREPHKESAPWTITLKRSANGAVGPFEHQIELIPELDAGGESAVPPLCLRISGRAVHDVQPLPEVAHFGLGQVGERRSTMVTLASTRKPIDRVWVKQPLPAGMRVRQSEIAVAGGVSFELVQDFLVPHICQSIVTFDVQQGDRRYEVLVPIRYQGSAGK